LRFYCWPLSISIGKTKKQIMAMQVVCLAQSQYSVVIEKDLSDTDKFRDADHLTMSLKRTGELI